MKFLKMLIAHLKCEKKGYRLEMPIGFELSAVNRASIYGCSDKCSDEAKLRYD